jgi:phospho-N-acetylmuramoyl-pentapeptide-transferase
VSSGAYVALAALLGLLASGAYLQVARRAGWGKPVRSHGPRAHLGKAGTPTMGGAAILLVGVLLAVAIGPRDGDLIALALLVLAAAGIGLADDVTSLWRSRRAERDGRFGIDVATGVLARYRLLVQAIVGATFAAYAVARADVQVFGPAWLDVLFLAVAVVGTINAFNFSDGLDGLAAGIGAITLLPFLGAPLAATVLGALLGFLWYNAHPARLFMGGVGAEGLGALVAGLAILSGNVWWLPLLALVPLLEVVSVIVQVVYFRATGGRRLLRMAPLHHHLELSGWPETRVVLRLWLVTAAVVALTVAWWGGA